MGATRTAGMGLRNRMDKIRRVTVAEAVSEIARDELLLPGIQRNFVWSTKQICELFDSLMRGYPIGGLLVWRTRPADNPQLPFRRLVLAYHGPTTTAQRAYPRKGELVSGVLDGQQRLTALNVGIRGSHAGSTKAPPRRLYIDLDVEEVDPGAERPAYCFEFRANDRDGDAWFPVGDAIGVKPMPTALNAALDRAGVPRSLQRRQVLKRLVTALNSTRNITLHLETGDLDRVLNVFARTNMGGTKLTYVELLVSAASARWRHLDAAEAISDLRRDMNETAGEGFRFTADRIVKAGLVLLDVKEPKFHAQSFMQGNKAQELEAIWPKFSRSMVTAADVLAGFGLSGASLPAENVLIPIAYYVFRRGLPRSYATADKYERDRRRVRAFVARTLLQRRYWTGAVDPVLTASRSALKANGGGSFPLDELEVALRPYKPIDVTAALLDELCELPYSDRRTATLLRLLFPHMVLHRPGPPLDKDHVFPVSKFLVAAHFRGTSLDRYSAPLSAGVANRLPNLQLLCQADNRGGKAAKWPKQWLDELGPAGRKRYASQGVKHLPDDLTGFEAFYQRRRAQLRSDIQSLLSP